MTPLVARLRTHNQNITVAARMMAERKTAIITTPLVASHTI
jgi:hypothetical protein